MELKITITNRLRAVFYWGDIMGMDITDNSAQIKNQMKQNIAKALEMVGLKNQEIVTKIITDMRAVDTGRLRSSMTYKVDAPNDRVIVGTALEYAPYVHEGTVN